MYLTCKNLGFSYDGVKNTLSGINLEINKGETLAIVRASGCGKSTLVRIITGIMTCKNSNRRQVTKLIENQTLDQYIQKLRSAILSLEN